MNACNTAPRWLTCDGAGLGIAACADGLVPEGRLRGYGAQPGAGSHQRHQVCRRLLHPVKLGPAAQNSSLVYVITVGLRELCRKALLTLVRRGTVV